MEGQWGSNCGHGDFCVVRTIEAAICCRAKVKLIQLDGLWLILFHELSINLIQLVSLKNLNVLDIG